MHATQILGLTLFLTCALFAAAGTAIERTQARHQEVTTASLGVRLLLVAGGTFAAGLLLSAGAALAH